EQFQKAIQIEPFHPYANIYYASTALLAGRLPDALPQLEVWLRMSPRNPAPVLYKAVALTLLGKHADADQVMKELELGPERSHNISKGALASYKSVLEMLRAMQTTITETPLDARALISLVSQIIAINQRAQQAAAPGEDSTGVFRVPLMPAQRQALGK